MIEKDGGLRDKIEFYVLPSLFFSILLYNIPVDRIFSDYVSR